MKKMMKLKALMAMGTLLLVLTACENFVTHNRAGEPVSFGASADHKGVATKTAYSGIISGGKERIDWVDGDRVRIFMYTHDAGNRWGNSGVSFMDYSVVNIRAQGERSIGQLLADGSRLEWSGTLEHDFYSFYPPRFGGYNAQMEQAWFWGGNNAVTFWLPSDQSGESSGSNMEHLYMAAVAEGFTSEGRGSVELDYYPMVTTLHFTLQNSFTTHEAVSISKVALSATNWAPITGTYTASVQGGKFVPDADNAYNGSTSITLNVSKTVRYGDGAEFVFFLVPRSSYDPANLKLTVTTDQGEFSIPLTNTQVSAFESCKKYFLTLNINESAGPVIVVSQAAQILAALSDSPVLERVEYIPWMETPGFYYKEPSYPKVPISAADLATLFETVTTIVNYNNTDFNYLLKNLTPDDMSVFPNLRSLRLSDLGNTETIDAENLNNLLELAFAGNPSHVTVSNCSFSSGAQPLVLNATRTMDVDINNVSGLSEVHLMAGQDNLGGNIGCVNIHDCPDLKVIKVYRSSSNAQVAMSTAEFANLPLLETIYLDQVNATNSISISNCAVLSRVIVANQTNWLLKAITLSNLPVLGDAAADSSEYGMTGLNVDKVSPDIYASKVNCPNLGPSFVTYQPYSESPVTITFH